MKPDEEMHADVAEEVDLDPRDVYTDLGTLIIEGRVPGLTERGYGEGPHCLPIQGQNRHQCDPTSPQCQHYDATLKHMLLLWKNGIPMSIEVLLYPECCATSTHNQTIDSSSVPDMAYLLEQWTVNLLPRRMMDATVGCRGLIQAVRSFLYFSQLGAWLSLTGGQSPRNVHYRVCVPGEAFSSKFTTEPLLHVFPVANIGRNNSLKVIVKYLPRSGKLPVISCRKHNIACQGFTPPRPMSNKMQLMKPVLEETTTANIEEEEYCPEDGIISDQPSSLKALQKSLQSKSPTDSMLGDSLLDPPPSLQMYPKRYQSPSRCGSPSIEVPEHLMFGKAANIRREAERKRIHTHTKERSRPHRRPVVERFLNKNFGEMNKISKEGTNEKQSHSLEKLDSMKSKLKLDQEDQVCNYVCNTNNSNRIPQEEMEHVLNRLRQRCPGTKHSTVDSPQLPFENNPSVLKSIPFRTDLPSCSKQKTVPIHEIFSTNQRTLSSNLEESESKNINIDKYQLQKSDILEADIENTLQSLKSNAKVSDQFNFVPSTTDNISTNFKRENQTEQTIDRNNKLENENTVVFCTKTPAVHSDSSAYPSVIEKTINKQNFNEEEMNNDCIQKLLYNKIWTESSTFAHKTSLIQKLLKAGALSKESDLDRKGYTIPSADQKAQFRRSLDSATSMVFHQKTGLPLTSSPAPIRKSGTCFDFDSSLTSVSAIKRALFEKDPDDEVEKNLLSTSAPASITTSNLLGNFEESVLNGRLEPVSTVEGFTAELGASGSFCPRHTTLPVAVFFYTLQDTEKLASPYLGHINLGKKGYHVPRKGTVQVTLFNPHQTVVKMFVVMYDLSDMPSNCQTFIRQRTLYMPVDSSEEDSDASKWLRYLIHLRFSSSRSGRIYLHTDIRMIIFRKSDVDAATVHSQRPYELRSFTQGPKNPKFSPLK